MSIRVQTVVGEDWQKLRELRLRALATDPGAFGGRYQQAAALPPSTWRERAEVSERGEQSRWFAAADDDGEWVGMALAARDEVGTAHLFGMWVDPQARGSVAAGLLCEACAGWAASRGHEIIELSVVVENARAVDLYRKSGFVQVRTKVEEFGERSLRLVVMHRALGGAAQAT